MTDEAFEFEDAYGPFYRLDCPQLDGAAFASDVLTTGELHGGPPAGSDTPAVQAYRGPLPDGKPGFEFYAFARPTYPWGEARWREGLPGVDPAPQDRVKIRIAVTWTTYTLVPDGH